MSEPLVVNNRMLTSSIYTAFCAVSDSLELANHGVMYDRLREVHILLSQLHREGCALPADEPVCEAQ